DLSARTEENAGIEQPALRTALQQSKDCPDVEMSAIDEERFCARSRNGLSVGPGFLLALEGVAGQHTLRKNDEPGALCRGRFEPGADIAEVVDLVCEAAVHLNGSNRPLGHRLSLVEVKEPLPPPLSASGRGGGRGCLSPAAVRRLSGSEETRCC